LRGARMRSSVDSFTQPSVIPVTSPSSRLRLPGSDWLFAKLYCPNTFADDLITGPMSALCEYARSSGLADEWFFIRYSDPDPHLRLRFHGRPEQLVGELIPHVCCWAAGLVTEGLCSRFCIDTYDRELERYGGPASTAVAEMLFAVDSRAVVEMLRLQQQ